MDNMGKIVFSKIQHFIPDWAQNSLLLGIHSTHFPDIFHDDKKL